MPQDLAALLVEEGAVSQADMERALARQAAEGGGLDTALLELGLVGEGHLLSFLAHAAGVAAAPPDAYKEIDARARRVFPAKVAERHRLAPFALDGRELSVVACHPVDVAAIDEIGFMLSLTLVPHVGVEWRVHDLIHRLYGGQLPARLSKLADDALTAAAAPDAVAAAAEPAPNPPPAPPRAPSPSIEDAFFAAGDSGTFTPIPAPEARGEPFAGTAPSSPPEPVQGPARELAPEQGPAASAPPPVAQPPAEDDETSFADIEPERPALSGFARDESEPAEPLLAALEQAVDAYEALWSDVAHPARGAPPQATAPAAPASPEERTGPDVPPDGPAPAVEPPEEAAGESTEPEEPEGPPPELDRSAPPRWSLDDARTALAVGGRRDEVVLTALRYARDFFEYAALFAVTRDAVVGHDALGPQEDERSHARGTAIYASDAGIIRTVLETGAPYLGPVMRDAVGTSNILDGLWRGTPRTVLVYPILVADRPVAVLYADNGEAPVSARRLGDLLLFLSTLGACFERIIRARKKRRRRVAAAPPEPTPPAEPPAPEPEPAPAWMEPPPSNPAPSDPPPPPEPFAPVSAPAPPAEPEVAAPAIPAPPAPELAPAVEPVAPSAAAASKVEEAMAALLTGAGGVPDRPAWIVDCVLSTDPEVAAGAREALVRHREDPAVKPVPERLRRALLSGVGERPALAARALGALRDVESIPILIQALEGGSASVAAEALDAITLHRLGTSPQKWLKWWKENRGRSRAEWLFAALSAPELDLRAAAARELRAAGEPPVRYDPLMPAAEREAAARAWWVWWARQGLRV